MLVGQGAIRFAERCGMDLVPDQYCITEDRVRQLNEVHLQDDSELTHADAAWQNDVEGHFGTIGAIARDVAGDLAAATSTGGIANKPQAKSETLQ